MTACARGSLLGIEHLQLEEISSLLQLARRMQHGHPRPLLRGKTVGLVFYEASTRTRASFEMAAKKLGGITLLVHASGSSIEKGESLLDTGYTLRAVGCDALVFRHPNAGAAHLIAAHLDVPVINAGDGMHEHPSQALLDAYTILQRMKDLRGKRMAIIGDIYHSRVARSNIHLLSKFGVQLTLCGPPEFVPETAATLVKGLHLTRHLDDAIRGADVIMLLRVQKERLAEMQFDVGEYIAKYQLTTTRLRLARPGALVMHPGPIIRGMELSSDVADSSQAVIRDEVRNGVAVRMAILARALGKAK
jgi:aspartate carbamoyltransferase catalytic subunit